MLMKMATLDGRNIKLFWSIDADGDKGFVLTFPSFVADEARNIIAQLPSLLQHLYGVEVLTLMSDAAQRQALAAPWDVSRMCARSKMDKQLEAMVIATAGMDDDVDSDLDDDDDSVDTAILDEEEAKDTNAFLFRKASSNDSVTTLDTRLGRPKSSKSKVVHKIDGSPPKRQKANQSNLTDEEMQEIHREVEQALQFDNEGVAMDSEPSQRQTQAPEPPEGLGDAL